MLLAFVAKYIWEAYLMKVVVAKPGKFLGGILRMIFGIKKEKESSY